MLLDDTGALKETYHYSPYGTVKAVPYLYGDFDEDGAAATSLDFGIFALSFGKNMGTDDGYDARADENRDGAVGVTEYGHFASSSGHFADEVPPGAISAYGNTIGYAGYVWEPNLGGNDSGMYQVRFRWYVVALGRWGRMDPLGMLARSNRYAYVLDRPLEFGDPLGLWGVRIGSFNIGVGSPWLYFNGNSYRHLRSDLIHGAEAVADGIVPFWDPFAQLGLYDYCDPILATSRRLGQIARDLYLAADIPSPSRFLEYLKNWRLYEKGSTTVGRSIFDSVRDLSPIERGRIYNAMSRSEWKQAVISGLPHWPRTFLTGLTPGGTVVGGTIAIADHILDRFPKNCGGGCP